MFGYSTYGCGDADWLTPISTEWTLTPVPYFSAASRVIGLESEGDLDYGMSITYYAFRVRPVAFLKSSTTISDSLGTQGNPFIAS